MKTQIFCLLFLILAAWTAENADAQKSREFPTTRESIADGFRYNDPDQPKTMFPSKGLPSDISDDRKPRVGALIQFDFDSDAIISDSYALLKEFGLVFEKDYPDGVFVIEGHADSKGTDQYNMNLSERRARAVKNFLTSVLQIDGNRLIVRAHGERRPIMSNDTEEGRALNRRVEFVRER
ncbi:OmpA family protein [Desulfococcaceae bacterium HSG8]|nr:OmpA family protein [Desulfococcaceae bacterium HSG8]